MSELLILCAISDVISTVMNQKSLKITCAIPLSNSSVSRRTDEMADDMETTSCINASSNTICVCALQIYESPLTDKETILMTYFRFLNIAKLKKKMFLPENLKQVQR